MKPVLLVQVLPVSRVNPESREHLDSQVLKVAPESMDSLELRDFRAVLELLEIRVQLGLLVLLDRLAL